MAVVGVAGGGPIGSAATESGEVVPIPPFAARNKRWTTFYGGVLVTEKGTGERDPVSAHLYPSGRTTATVLYYTIMSVCLTHGLYPTCAKL